MKEKKEKRRKYLSVRVELFSVVSMLLVLFLLAAGFVQSAAKEDPVWPWFLGLAVFAVLVWLWFLLLMKPYWKKEKTLRLFLEGYTTGNLVKDMDVTSSPMETQLLQQMDKVMDSTELLKLNKRQAQYLALQNQINPHFLYNTLESIRSEALLAGLDRVADMTEALASFFRYTISKVENLVSVEEELHNCETYFRIQQYRFGDRLHLTIECDPDDKEEIYRCRLPKLTMQPILENSIIHGTELNIGPGYLVIHLELTGKFLLIRISDNGVGMDVETLRKTNERLEKSGRALADQASDSGGGIALVNVNNRIHLLFGEEYGLHVYSMEGEGTDVEILLPAGTNDQEAKRGALA